VNRTYLQFSGGEGHSNVATRSKDATAQRGAQCAAQGSPRVQWALRLLAIGLGALHAWTAAVQQSMSEDGISYLDMGDAYLRGDWSMAINSVWSPLYAWVLGLAMKVLQPSMAWEFPVVHAVNFAIYLFALISFEFFWRQLRANRSNGSLQIRDKEVGFPEWAWMSIGYALFIWTSLSLIKIWAVTPDMLTAGLIYIAATLLLAITNGNAGWRTSFTFGVVLGLGYLAKAVMFPLAFLFLVVGLFVAGECRTALPRMFAAFIAFLLIAAPYVTALSITKGHLTFSEAGKLTYLRSVNGVAYPHWRAGTTSDMGTPLHPARQIFHAPAVFEFATPVGGTYPLSYDPSYWYEGVEPRLDLRKQAANLIESGQFYFDLLVRQQGGMTAIVLLFSLAAGGFWRGRRWLNAECALLVVSLAAFVLYAVVYVEGRYIGAFVVLFWAGLLSRLRLADSHFSQGLFRAGGAILVLFVSINILSFNLEGASKVLGLQSRQPVASSQSAVPQYRPVELAETVLEMGLRPGDEIAFIGYSFGAFFARLARLRIIAEIPYSEADRFWQADHSTRVEVLDAIRGTGAKALIAESLPPGVSAHNWKRIGESRHFLYRLT
jgi:hypothetical protein